MVNIINLSVRFILEMVALIALGMWGASMATGVIGIALAIGFPLLGAFMWGTFRVAGDPSNNGQAPVQVPGILRLLLELGLFAVAALAFVAISHTIWAVSLIFIVVVHYVISYERILWLISQ